MASFNKTIITNNGRSLIAKVLSGDQIKFTKMVSSSRDYTSSDLSQLTDLSNVEQTIVISSIKKTSDSAVKITGIFSNKDLKTGYKFKTVGLYAIDPDLGEILYSVTTASSVDDMPANTGIGLSSITIGLVTDVSNSNNASLEVSDVATVSALEFNEFKDEVNSHLNENANDIEILNKKDLRTNIHLTDATIFSPTLTSSHECWNKWVSVEGNNMEYAPHPGALWGEVFTGGTNTRAFQIFISTFEHARKIYVRYKHDSNWSEFRYFGTGYIKELALNNGWEKYDLTPTYSLVGNTLTVNARIRNGVVTSDTLIAETGFYASGGQSSFYNCYTTNGQQLGTIAFTSDGRILIVSGLSSNVDVNFNFSVCVN